MDRKDSKDHFARNVTIFDVAEKAGVSHSTVSRVLNDRPDVAPQTREAVLRVVREHPSRPPVDAASIWRRVGDEHARLYQGLVAGVGATAATPEKAPADVTGPARRAI